MERRHFLAALSGASYSAPAAIDKLAMPGLFPGRVVAVRDSRSIVSNAYQPEAVRRLMEKGMQELTGAPSWADSWRMFFQKGDVVGIKVSPVGGRKLCSDPTVLHNIIDGLRQAGIPPKDIVAYDRYRQEFMGAGFHKWLPEGVRWSWAAERYDNDQTGLEGYDPDVWVEVPLLKPGQDPRDRHLRRSYVAQFLTRQVNKVINLPVLKHHQSAGVTLCLKNLSHGMVNNVNRSHVNRTLNACSFFIPAVVETPVIRQKVVLHILDGVRGGYNNGPGVSPKFIWPHETMYFGTDPVAVDRIGWRVIDQKRAKEGLGPVSETPNDEYNSYRGQPEHIELAGALGLGVFDEAKIEMKSFTLG